MNVVFGAFALTALILGIIGMLTDSWYWIIPVLTIAGIIWCYIDADREEKEMAHRTER